MKYDIFISYSSQDLRIATDICQRLEKDGLTCWMAPRNIDTGVSFAKAIIDGIKSSHNVLLIYTANSNISEQVLREVDRAVHFEKSLLIFKLEEQKYSESLEYYLCKATCIDATKGAYKQYLSQIKNIVVLSTKQHPEIFHPSHESSSHATSSHIKKRIPVLFFFLVTVVLLLSGGIYYRKVLLSQTGTLANNQNLPSPILKANVIIKKSMPLPDDLYQHASEKLYDEQVISQLGFADLKLLSRQIQGLGGVFIQNSRAGLIENQLSDTAKNNLDLIDHFIVSRLSASLPGNLCKKFCLSILGRRPIQTSEYRVLKDLENNLVKKYGVKAQKLYKTITQKTPDACQGSTATPIEISFNQALGLDVQMKIFGRGNLDDNDKANDAKIKIELIETADDNTRIQVFFSKEENLVELIRKYAMLFCTIP